MSQVGVEFNCCKKTPPLSLGNGLRVQPTGIPKGIITAADPVKQDKNNGPDYAKPIETDFWPWQCLLPGRPDTVLDFVLSQYFERGCKVIGSYDQMPASIILRMS